MKPKYQCRLCNEQFITNDSMTRKKANRNAYELGNDNSKTSIHYCGDGSIGISDLIGFIPETNEEKIDGVKFVLSLNGVYPKFCGNCDKTDGLRYCSNPPKVRCIVTGDYHYYDDTCDIDKKEK